MKRQLVSIVVPVYNEEEVLPVFYRSLSDEIGKVPCEFEILFVDDGSTDGTGALITRIAATDDRVRGIMFSRNFGHQAALTAGMDYAKGDAIVCMDGDLQHPPSVIARLVEKWNDGYDVVYTIRKATRTVSVFKDITARMFYRLVNSLAKIPIAENAADFRLVSKKVADVFRQDIRERTRFLRGLVSWVGFRAIGIEFDVHPRAAGRSKYQLSTMLRFASSGLASFSTAPLRFGIYLGLLLGVASLGYGTYAIAMALFTEKTVSGWASLLTAVTFIGAVQFFLIGLIGEYIGYIFEEVKGRPLYVVRERIEGKRP